MSTTQQLAAAYRQQLNAEMKGYLSVVGDKLRDGKTGLALRAAYWKASNKKRERMLPRGKNYVLKYEGRI